ncbi:hypothetical protein L914_07430 [Phytophthora nicotianae]|uniref:Uncharacterized protein n=1 Tax=Phytophthora nicotianae TaxID=4792 RepID=W2NJ68_PHYNI|nr:hypothetical protein L914_07430 [Phytophthora nicotianae]
MQELGYKFRVSKRKGKKYDALLSDGRVVSFGAIKSNGEPYQQYQDRTNLKAYRDYDHKDTKRRERYYKRHGPIDDQHPYTPDCFRNQLYSRLIAGFDGFDFVGELTRIEKMIESQQERIQEAQNQLNLINREFLPGDIESVYRDRALTAMNDSSDKIDRLEILKDELKRLQLL